MISHVFTWGSLGFYFCVLFFLYSDGLCLLFPDIFQFLGNILPSVARGWGWGWGCIVGLSHLLLWATGCLAMLCVMTGSGHHPGPDVTTAQLY